MTLSGYTVTQYRERDKLIDVDLRAPKSERIDPSKLTGLVPTPHGPCRSARSATCATRSNTA